MASSGGVVRGTWYYEVEAVSAEGSVQVGVCVLGVLIKGGDKDLRVDGCDVWGDSVQAGDCMGGCACV